MKNYKIIQGDCVIVTAELDSESIDLSVFSTPYDNIRDYKKGWVFNYKALDYKVLDYKVLDYKVLDYKALGKSLYNVTKDGGVCAVVIGDGTKKFAKSLTTFKLAVDWCEDAGWRLFETCIYQRAGDLGAWWNSRFHCCINAN